ncbi:MAG: hypothetical protein V3V25_12615 [Paracoccaceae bacterium]
METRGPIMIVTSLSLVFSMVAVIHIQNQTEETSSDGIKTVGEDYASCSSRGLETMFGRLGCANSSKVTNRRTAAGGAVFLSIKN